MGNTQEQQIRRIETALGQRRAELVFKNACYLNVFTNQFLRGDIAVEDGVIAGIGEYEGIQELDASKKTVVPGFIDGHIHLESSVVVPEEFARIVSMHGTSAVITDPHEITNVCGADGLEYMMESVKDLPVDVFFMVPSCVPASPFDENGALFDASCVEGYMGREKVLGLAEMMNYPGIMSRDPEIMVKLRCAQEAGKLVDGHAPGLSGKQLQAYISCGISSDHECSTAKEAMEKFAAGQWIMVREGTASRNLEALLPMFQEPYASRSMLTTDDKHPGDLLAGGHMDYIIRKAISLGADPALTYKMASWNAASYFRLPRRGAIAPGYLADLVVLSDKEAVVVEQVYKRGIAIEHFPVPMHSAAEEKKEKVMHTVCLRELSPEDFMDEGKPAGLRRKVIGLIPGELITTDEGEAREIQVSQDILKAAVLERHRNTGHIGICFMKGYGLKSGAVATSVAHDSHNIIVVGASEDDMARAVNRIRELGGGMVVAEHGRVLEELPLPIAGLMCELTAAEAKAAMDRVRKAARRLGVSEGIDPFMTLAFVSLPVIPKWKLTSLGVVDVEQFCLAEPGKQAP